MSAVCRSGRYRKLDCGVPRAVLFCLRGTPRSNIRPHSKALRENLRYHLLMARMHSIARMSMGHLVPGLSLSSFCHDLLTIVVLSNRVFEKNGPHLGAVVVFLSHISHVLSCTACNLKFKVVGITDPKVP